MSDHEIKLTFAGGDDLDRLFTEWLKREIRTRGKPEPQPEERTMIPFIRKYAKAIVAAIGYVASIATALGLTHYHWVSVVLGVLSTIAVVLTKNSGPAPVPPASPAAR